MKYASFVLPILVLLHSPGVFASVDSDLTFTKLSVDDGLSQCTVFDIVQDESLNMWFATYDGLCRYDGYDFTVFRHSESDASSISGNIIRSLMVDSEGRLWAGTNSGISIYDEDRAGFLNISLEGREDAYFYKLLELPDGTVLTYSDQAYYLIHKDLSVQEWFQRSVSRRDDVDLSGGRLFYYSAENGLFEISIGGNRTFVASPFTNERLMDIMVGADGNLYMASNGDGMFVLEHSSGRIVRYSHDPSNASSLCSNYLRTLCQDSSGNIWIGTGYGLSIFDPAAGTFHNSFPNRLHPESLSHSSINKIARDGSGGVWIGTFFGGVNYYHPYRDIFKTVRLIQTDKDVIGCVRCDRKGRIWLGTGRDGVCIYDLSSGSVKWLRSGNGDQAIEAELNDIKDIAFCETLHETYFAADLGGLTIYNERTGKISQFSGSPRRIYSILEESDGMFWLGTSSGLYLFDAKRRSLKKVPLIGNSRVAVVAEDLVGNIWIGTSNCLFECRLAVMDGEPVVSFHKEFNDIPWAQDICVTKDNYIWVATRYGLFRYCQDSENMTRIEAPLVESGSVLKGIVEDNQGMLWISSENGLCRFDPETEVVRKFSSGLGLYNTIYNIKSHEKLPDGTILFGGIDGLTIFNPEHIKSDNSSPAPRISAFYAGGDAVDCKCQTSKIRLRPDRNTVEFELSVPNYITWKENGFSYFLDGFDSSWSEVSRIRKVKYPKLPKGNYVFHVKSCNSEGVWSDEEAAVKFRVLPRWYESFAFTLFVCIVTLTFLVYVLLRVRTSIRAKNEMRIARIKKESAKELGELRFRMFINSAKPGLKLSTESLDFLSRFYDVEMRNMEKEHYGVDDIARDLCMSRSTLHAKMKESLGISAHEYMDLIKFEEAKRLLAEGKMRVSEIAFRLGYSAPAYFTTSFKRFTGKTPSEYMPEDK